MFAGARRLSNLCCLVDANRLQNETWVEATLPLGNVADKWRSFGWIVDEIDGHHIPVIRAALGRAARQSQGPSLILAHTVKGKGVSFMENDNAWHGKGMSESEYRRALDELAVVLRQHGAV